MSLVTAFMEALKDRMPVTSSALLDALNEGPKSTLSTAVEPAHSTSSGKSSKAPSTSSSKSSKATSTFSSKCSKALSTSSTSKSSKSPSISSSILLGNGEVDDLINNLINNLIGSKSSKSSGSKSSKSKEVKPSFDNPTNSLSCSCFTDFTNGKASSTTWPDEGIILSSGPAESILDAGATTNNILGIPGDADLNGINPVVTNDACFIEFDISCPSNTALLIDLNFVFASEENGGSPGSFNDIFGLFVDDVNIALIPGTNLPVNINNVAVNAAASGYVIPGGDDNTPVFGYSGLLSASSAPLVGTHKIKLAIADGTDSSFNSWVLIQSGAFSCSN